MQCKGHLTKRRKFLEKNILLFKLLMIKTFTEELVRMCEGNQETLPKVKIVFSNAYNTHGNTKFPLLMLF